MVEKLNRTSQADFIYLVHTRSNYCYAIVPLVSQLHHFLFLHQGSTWAAMKKLHRQPTLSRTVTTDISTDSIVIKSSEDNMALLLTWFMFSGALEEHRKSVIFTAVWLLCTTKSDFTLPLCTLLNVKGIKREMTDFTLITSSSVW